MEPSDTTVIIVGAGLTGIGAAYYLSKNNIDHVLLEKSDSPGGIWSSQKWPGIRCDTDIIKYSYSFKPLLSEQCLVPGKIISNYLDEVSREFGIRDRTVFGVRVERAEFNSRECRWYVHTNNGVFYARFLINANGYFLDAPHSPPFAGTETFKGELVHLFHLDEHARLKSRNIVLVGSGASAITAAPVLCEQAASVTLLQRSPSYIYEEDNRIGLLVNLAQKLYRAGVRFPFRIVTYFMQLKDDLIFVLFRKLPWTGKLIFKHHWKDTVDEDTYRTNFTPSYNPWEQRIPVAIGLKDAIRNGKLKVVTGRIDRFAESGIQLKDGRQLETDLCILATGFDLTFFKFEISIDGRPVDTADINFYKGMMMGGIPNYFQPFVAPHSSFTRRVEVVSRLIVKIIHYMRKHQLDRVSIERKKVEKVPRITPNYVMRNLDRLPAIYGTFELPSIDSPLFFRFRKSNYTFFRMGTMLWRNRRNEATTRTLSTRADFKREVRLGKELKQKLRDAGCFAPARVQQVMHILLVLLAYTGGYALLLTDPPVLIQLTTLFTMAIVNVRAGFIAHEAGHGAITCNIRLARFIGRLFNTLLTALAYSHFQYIHTRHHAYCNDRIKDPDIQSNIFSLYPQAVAEKRRAVSRFITRYQHYLIWPLVSLQGFSLKVDSIQTLRRMPERTRVDQVLLLMHLLLWLAVPSYVLGLPTALANYLLMTWFIGPYLGSVFLVNHIGTHVVEPDESMPVFLQRLITTRNLGDSKIANWYFGGINHHIEHHLFPTIPSARLANARTITRAFCQEHGLPYRETSWLKAVGETMHYLDDVAEIGQALQPAGHQED